MGTRPTNIAYITPSIASYTGFNHGYRLYTVDAGHPDETYRILDTETFVFDLPSANAAGPDVLPNWYKIYSAREDLEMENLFPAEWNRVVHRLANEEDFYKKWLKYYNKGGPREVSCVIWSQLQTWTEASVMKSWDLRSNLS